MMLGLLLARAGVDVLVLEKHKDFLRDFRGDTIHPSTLELMYELGILDTFLARPHQELRQVTGYYNGEPVTLADLTHLPTHCKFVALMPQWDFLNFIAEQARAYSTFHLQMEAEVVGLLEQDGRVVGVRVHEANRDVEVRAPLVVGADGRSSVVRERAGLLVEDFGAPMDVLWMRLPRAEQDAAQVLGYFDNGRIFIMLGRGDYWQCGFVIAKGQFDAMRREPIARLQQLIVGVVPWLKGRVTSLASWDDVKLLTVRVDRLKEWSRDGLLCIGDAAHAMSPIGGVGINLAIQDAVATSNLLADCLKSQRCTHDDLRRVQARREWPTKMTQRLQLAVQNRVIAPTLADTDSRRKPPLFLNLVKWLPVLRRIPARVLAVGFRPEHIS
jgi:2-polyprenyl-6-methoxyphenol hydroxylase-like FAD-dependent oxidoreductase